MLDHRYEHKESITLMNNNAAHLISACKDRQAIGELRCVLDRLLTEMHQTIVSSENSSAGNGLSYDQNIRSDMPTDCEQATSQLIVAPCLPTQQKAGTLSPVCSLFIYQSSILLINIEQNNAACENDDCKCRSFDVAMKSAAVLFNLGLAFHRLGLESPNENVSREQFLVKASTFYGQAIALSLPYLPSSPSSYRRSEHGAQISAMICVATLNNLGQIHLDHLNDCTSAQGIFEQLRQIAQNGSAGSPNSGGSRLFSEQDWNGVLGNLALVSIIAGSVAAGAA